MQNESIGKIAVTFTAQSTQNLSHYGTICVKYKCTDCQLVPASTAYVLCWEETVGCRTHQAFKSPSPTPPSECIFIEGIGRGGRLWGGKLRTRRRNYFYYYVSGVMNDGVGGGGDEGGGVGGREGGVEREREVGGGREEG